MKIRKKTVLSLILAIAVVAGTTVAFATSAKEDTPMTPLAEDMTISAPADRDNTATPPETDKNAGSVQTPVELKENGQTKPVEELAASGSDTAPDTGKQPDGGKGETSPKEMFISRYAKDEHGPYFATEEERDSYDRIYDEIKETQTNNGEYFKNSAGQTYGTAYGETVVGHAPDLIGHVGDGGVSGYVKNEDMNPKINNPREAMEYMVNFNDNRVKTLYDVEGNPIGTVTLPELSADRVAGAQKALDEMKANHMYED